MSTVNCPNCNKPNIEGSKFCNSCGSALPPSTHIACPNCGTRNPKNLLYCDNCGTRLLATGELSSRREETKEPEAETRTPRAFSLPTRDPGDELEEDNLLDWLRTGEEQAGGETADPETKQEAVLGDWLSELSDVESSEGEADEASPDWFQDTGESQEDAVSADLAEWFSESDETLIEEGGLADWLNELEEAGDDEEQAEEAALDDTIPDWLNELEEDDSQPESEEETFADWLSDFNEEEETAEEDTFLPETEILGPDDSSSLDIADTLITPTPLQETDEDLPEWLSSSEDSEKGNRPVEELADWLSEFNDEEETPTLVESTSKQDDLPEWLSSLEDVEKPEDISEAEELPDWLGEESGAETPTQIAATPEKEDEEALPDWLSESVGEPETAPTESAEEESLPDWLSETAVEEEQPTLIESMETSEDQEGELPDWLSEFVDEEGTGEADLAEVLPELDEESDWLGEFGEGEETLVGQEPIAESAEEASLPDWLSDFTDDVEPLMAEEPFSEMAEEEVLSDWLSDFESTAESEEDTVTAIPEEAAGGDWLEDSFEDESEIEETAISMMAEDSPESEAGEDALEGDLPDWLSDMPSYDTKILSDIESDEEESADIFAELGDTDLSPVDSLPDWLSEVASEVKPVEEPVAEAEPEDDDFSDWFSDLPDEEETFEEEGDTDWLSALALDEPWPETAEDEEIAAQVDELETAETAEPEPTGPSHELMGVPKELVGSDLPDWLQDDMPPSDAGIQDTGEDLFGMEAGELAAGDLPDWLQQMKPAEMKTAPEDDELGIDFSSVETQDEWQDILENMPAAPSALPGGAELSSAEIPAWLQALKPRDLGEEEEELLQSDEPPETEGPLAGLRGVLPIAAVVSEATASKTPSPYTISKEQQQQIALLHRLTHEEPEARKQVAVKKAATFSTTWRVLLSILLFLVVLAGVILPRTDIGLPETALPVPQSAFDAFNSIKEVNGRSVLVAFDYTPAMAGELDPIALMLMRQVAENGNRVVTISQSAVGTAIAGRLIGEVDGLQSRDLPVLTGEAIGLRSLASCLANTAENCDPLYDTSNPELMADLANVGLIIVLTSDRNSLVNWVEQVESEVETPVVAAVIQPLGPLTIPYVSSGQLDGTLNGIPAASAYEKRLRGLDGSAFEQFTAQTIVMWVVIISLIVTSVVYGTTGLAEGRTKKESE